MRDSTQLVAAPTTFVAGDSTDDDYEEVLDSVPEVNSSSEDESRNMGILTEGDDDYDDVWESSEHLLKLQTELDVLTSRARLVQSDRQCRRPQPSQRRVVEDYEEKWREQLRALGENRGPLDTKLQGISGSFKSDQQETCEMHENSDQHEYSEIPEHFNNDYSEISENADHHDYCEIPENSDHHDYSEIPEINKPEDVYCLETLVFNSQNQAKNQIWDPKKLKLQYRGSVNKSSKLKRKTSCPSDKDMGKSGHLLRTVH